MSIITLNDLNYQKPLIFRQNLHEILRDSAMVQSLNKTLNHIETGTDNFSQNMEALKHNFLFKGYFNKLEKEKKKKNGQ